MSQQDPQPHSDGGAPQQPGWGGIQQPGGGVPQQPWPPQQPWGAPPPPKRRSTGKIVGLGCLGVVAFVVVLGVISAAVGGKSDDKAAKSGAPAAAASTKHHAPADPKPAGKAPVQITAKKTAFSKSILADGGDYTSVAVTIRNNGAKKVSVNPLYFTVTDTDGTKHTSELGVDDKQLDTVDLAPGENISGTVTGKGTFTPRYVTFTEDLFGDPVRVDVH
ncbi:DUF4352 domain-containing protein [Streptomyces filipinensis]|uniref:DUF4352 domain-containing protein n=1 Tax=Streptomyces filipinensis TaxID=66887 RepID=UPI0036EDA7FF